MHRTGIICAGYLREIPQYLDEVTDLIYKPARSCTSSSEIGKLKENVLFHLSRKVFDV